MLAIGVGNCSFSRFFFILKHENFGLIYFSGIFELPLFMKFINLNSKHQIDG
jgi:hypothetical protein